MITRDCLEVLTTAEKDCTYLHAPDLLRIISGLDTYAFNYNPDTNTQTVHYVEDDKLWVFKLDNNNFLYWDLISD